MDSLSNKIHIVTVATHPKFYFNHLKKSCEANGVHLEVLGFGEKWLGFTWRLQLIKEHLQNINPKDTVCFIDGYDVFCTRHLETLHQSFMKIKNREKCKIIAGNDRYYYHKTLNSWFSSAYFGKCNGQHLNAGTYIGSCEDILHLINNVHKLFGEDPSMDDQYILTQYCNLYPSSIYVDIHSELFLTIVTPLSNVTDDKKLVLEKKGISYNGHVPYFIHAPVNGILDDVIKHYGYEVDDSIRKEFYTYRAKQSFEYVKKGVIIISVLLLVGLMSYFAYKYYTSKQTPITTLSKGASSSRKMSRLK